MQKLRAYFPGSGNQNASITTITDMTQLQSVVLEPEVGFQITIESSQQTVQTPQQSANALALDALCQQRAFIPELNVHLLAARHLPHLFGFKIVQGYQIKVKLFPGSKRLDSSIQTNSWPKFNENFRFALAPDIKPSLKHSSRCGSKTSSVSELFTPEELFAGQFVVFTVYALLELPPASFNRFNKTYRSLRDKSSNLVQKVVENSSGKSKDGKENDENVAQRPKRRSKDNQRDSMPALTISESRRNLGSVTCYLGPQLFTRNPRTGHFTTEELWLPIKDITTTSKKNELNDLTNAVKGVVEIILEVRNANKIDTSVDNVNVNGNGNGNAFERLKSALTPPTTPTTPPIISGAGFFSGVNKNNNSNNDNNKNEINHNTNDKVVTTPTKSTSIPNATAREWNRLTAEVKRKMGYSNISKSALEQNELSLRITTSRMRCTTKVKDELECTAGSVYVKTAVFEHGIYVNSWKCPNFYPSLSTKFDHNEEMATICIPIQSVESLDNLLIRTTLATKTKIGKKIVLGTVLIGIKVPPSSGNGALHMQQLQISPLNEPNSMWHNYV